MRTTHHTPLTWCAWQGSQTSSQDVHTQANVLCTARNLSRMLLVHATIHAEEVGAPPPTRCTSWGFDRQPHLLSLIGCSLQHTWLQVGGYRRPRPAQRDWRRASMSESGWRAVAFCATESRGAQREAVMRPWAQAEVADSAALDTQARRSPATSCAPTRARASLPGWPTASCNCSLKTPRSPARSALLSRWPYAAAARRPRATPTAPQHVHPIAVCLPYLSGRAGHLQPGARGPCSAALGPR